LVNILRRVESGVQKAADAWKVGTSHFVSSYKIINNQIDNINALLQLQRTSITTIYEDIRTRFMTEAKFKLLNEKTINDLSRVTLQISEIDLLFVAVQPLLSGQLPQFLIPHKDLQRGIDHFKEFLQTHYPDLQLYREDLYYYYKYVKFNVIQLRNNIVMILHVPLQHLDLKYDLDIYRLQKIPLAVPGSTVDFTILEGDFYAIGHNRDADYYIIFENVQAAPTDILDLRHSNVILRSRDNNTSCALNLMEGQYTFICICMYVMYMYMYISLPCIIIL